jgi:hypothetical protein
MILTTGKVGVSQSLTLEKQTTLSIQKQSPIFGQGILLGDEIHFGNIQKNLAEARLRQKNQDQLKEEEQALKGYPEYRDLMLGKIQLSHNQTMTGMEFLQLIHKEQFYKKFGLKSNTKRLLATALCATLLGPIVYDIIDAEINGGYGGKGFQNIKRQFNFGVHLPTIYSTIGVNDHYDSVLSKIRYSKLVEENESLGLIRLTPKGLHVLKNYEAQQKNGFLTTETKPETSEQIQANVKSQLDQIEKLTGPVFEKSNVVTEENGFLTRLKLLISVEQSQTWISRKIKRGVSKPAILKKLGVFKPLGTEEQLQFNQALTILVNMGLLKGNSTASHFQLTEAGKKIIQKGLNSPQISLLKETAQALYKDKKAWYSTEKHLLLKKMDSEVQAQKLFENELNQAKLTLQQQYQLCQQLQKRKQEVTLDNRPAYLLQVEQAVRLYRELINKVDFHQSRLLEQEKKYETLTSKQASTVAYLEKQEKVLQQKLWVLESNATEFKPDDVMRDVMSLAHQRFLYQNGLAVDLTSSPTDEEVNRILCEVSIEDALETIVSKPPVVEVPVYTEEGGIE